MASDYTTFTETYAYAHAHHLPTFPDGHKCREVHGHLTEVTITFDVDHSGRRYAFDHAEIDRMAARVLSKLDHVTVNNVNATPSTCEACGTVSYADDGPLFDGLAETQLDWLAEQFKRELGMVAGAMLREVHLDEWSTGSTFRLVKHRKSWRSRETVAMLRDIREVDQ